MTGIGQLTAQVSMSLPARGVWIEIADVNESVRTISSLPARGVWIEITPACTCARVTIVTPREGSVD